MPQIHVLNTGERIETDLVTSILNALHLNSIPIEAVCGGRAKCGKCAVRIVRGSEWLTKMNDREERRLGLMNADAPVRLACQTYTRGDIEIEIINLKRY